MGIHMASCFSGVVIAAAVLVGCGSSNDTGGGGGGEGPGTGDGGASSHVDSGGSFGSDAGPSFEAGTGADGAPSSGSDGGAGGDAGHPGADAGSEASSGNDSGAFVPASHPPFPKLANSGGSVLATPKVVGVFFSNYDHIAEVDAMLQGLATVVMPDGQPYWSSAVGEYGVGPLTVLPSIKLTQAAPTTSPNPASFVQTEVQSDPAFAGVDAETIVAIFYPSTTPLTGSCAAPASADGFGGYHTSTSTTKGRIPYAVILECANYAPSGTTLDMVTIAGSHEIIEASTDPFPSTSPAYATLDSNGWAMDVLLQGNEENGDMCAINDGFGRPSAQYPYLLQRGWSNKAAAGNADPCQPAMDPAQPFVGAFPVMPDMVTAKGASGTGPGVKIPTGQSKTIEVDCFSYEATAPFTVGARQSRAISPPELAFAWDSTSCVNGDKRHLTITVNSQGTSGYEAFLLYTEVPGATDMQKPAWAGIVAP